MGNQSDTRDPPLPERLDLRGAASDRRYALPQVVFRWVGLAVGVAGFATVAYFSLELLRGQVAVEYGGEVIGTFGAFSALCFGLFLILGPSPTWVEIGVTGLRFGYPVRTVTLPWDSPRFSMCLYRYCYPPSPALPQGLIFYAWHGTFPTWNYLTEDAFTRIVQASRDHGLSVLDSPSPTPRISKQYIITARHRG